MTHSARSSIVEQLISIRSLYLQTHNISTATTKNVAQPWHRNYGWWKKNEKTVIYTIYSPPDAANGCRISMRGFSIIAVRPMQPGFWTKEPIRNESGIR